MPAGVATTANFNEKVLESSKPILVDFWADWCGPCKQVAPILDQISNEYPAMGVVKLNVDENPEIAAQYSITSIPTMMVFKNGEVDAAIVGAKNKNALLNDLMAYLY